MTMFALPRSVPIPLATTILAGMLVAACAPVATAPQQMRSSLPSVTFRYSSDQDLVQANQSAASYCIPFQATPRAKSFSDEPDGTKSVLFECVQIATVPAPIAPQPYTPNFVYAVRTDQDVLDATQNAQNYCLSTGAGRVLSTIGATATGGRTITFQCIP